MPSKLNLGCGEDIREGFYNVDVRNLPGVDLVANACKLPTLLDSSADFIVAQHLLEYIPRKRMIGALTEWKRLLKANGILEIRVTDLEALTKAMYMNTTSGEMGLHHEMVISLIYGKQATPHDVRFNGFTQQFLEGVLRGVGYQVTNCVKENYDIIVTSIKE